MFVVLDKEEPCIGRIRGFDLAAIRPTTAKLTALSVQFSKSLRNQQHKPALTADLSTCIASINDVQYNALTVTVHRVHSDLYTMTKLTSWCSNCWTANVALAKTQTPVLSKRRPHFETRERLGENINLGRGPRGE